MVSGTLTSLVWKDKQGVHIPTNMHRPPTEGYFCDEQGQDQKSVVIEECSWHMGYIINRDRMANACSVSWRTQRWMSCFSTSWSWLYWIAVSLCHSGVAELTTGNFIWFWFKLCWKWIQRTLVLSPPQEEDHPPKSVNWHNLKDDTLNIGHLQDCVYSVVCAQPNKHSATKFQCKKCEVMLCMHPCFRIYHMEVHC